MASLDEDEKKLIRAIRELGVKPKADSAQDLQKWLTDFHMDQDGDEQDYDGEETSKTYKISPNTPKISTFYGDVDKLTKGEVVFDQWKYEIESLMEENKSEKTILQALRRSVKGSAAKVLKRMRVGSSLIDIIKKFDSVYGSADSKATILRNFYSAEQSETESVREWSCRLEELLDKAIDQGLVKPSNTNSMLCDKFWSGLKPEIRDITGYKFDSIDDFDELRVEVKKIEQEFYRKDRKSTDSISKSGVPSKKEEEMKSEIDDLKIMMKKMASSVETIGHELKELTCTVNQQQLSRHDNRGRGRSQYNDGTRNRRQFNDDQSREQHDDYSRRRQDGYSRRHQQDDHRYSQQHDDRNQSTFRRKTNYQGRQDEDRRQHQQPDSASGAMGHSFNDYRDHRRSYDDGPLCYRCGQRGHIQWYCKVRTDHCRKPLN